MSWKKLEFLFQSFLFRFSFVAFFVLFLGVFYYAYYTEINREPVGEYAPFREAQGEAGDGPMIAIEKPHRTRKEIQSWALQGVSELLHFDQSNREAVMARAQDAMSDKGWQQYREYLQSSGLIEAIETQNRQLSAVVEEMPLMLNEGPIGGTYRWLVDVPVVLTLVRAGETGYNARQTLDTRRATIRVQLGRAPVENNPDRIIIESWNVSRRR